MNRQINANTYKYNKRVVKALTFKISLRQFGGWGETYIIHLKKFIVKNKTKHYSNRNIKEITTRGNVSLN
jgi:hypothetical protein